MYAALKDYLWSLNSQEDDDNRAAALLELSETLRILDKFPEILDLYEVHKSFMKGRKEEKEFAMFCRKKAEDLKSTQEVKGYINDAEALSALLKKISSEIQRDTR